MSERKQPALKAYWSKRERDLVYWHDKFPPDGHLLDFHLTPLSKELEKRGYDLSTFRFSIRRKATP